MATTTNNIYLDPPEPMTCKKDAVIDGEIVKKYIDKHQEQLPRYQKLKQLYKGDHDIIRQTAKEDFKPDNRVIVNLAKVIVDTFMGFFNGIPIKKKHSKKKVAKVITEFDNRNDIEDQEYELAKIACIYGHGFEYMFQDEDTKTCVVYNSPEDMFLVFDNTVKQQPLFAVRYGYDEDDDGKIYGQLFTLDYEYTFTGGDGDEITIDEGSKKVNPFDEIPVYEFIHNEERMSVFESVLSAQESLNKTFSEKANDIDYFADAYLAIIGAKIEDGNLVSIRDNRTINLYNESGQPITLDAKFLEKPSADGTQEHYLDRLERFIYQVSMVANISDQEFGNSSGVALAYKLLPMQNLAMTMQRKYVSSLKQRYRRVLSLRTNILNSFKDQWQDIEFSFTRNIPQNVLEESQIMQNVDGIVSKETQLSVFSKVDDPAKEIERMKQEAIDERKDPAFDFSEVTKINQDEVANEDDQKNAGDVNE